MFICLACYFFLQAVFRILVSDAAELDESEQVLLTQGFRWGYGAQPPLYTWLQTLVFTVTGVNVIGLALFKMVLLFGTCGFLFFAAKEITSDENASILATVSLLLVPQFVWESQRDLTHSVLAMLMGAATLFIGVRVLKYPRSGDYLLLGICLGLGVLSKYNYLLFVASLAIAASSIAQFRPAVANWRILLSAVVAVVITAPHWYWLIVQHGGAAVAPVHSALREPRSFSRMISPVTSALFFVVGLIPVYCLLFGRAVLSLTGQSNFQKLLFRTFVFGLGFGLVMAAVCNTRFQVRWMQPILFAVPIYLASVVVPAFNAHNVRRLVMICVAVAAVVLIALPVTPVAAAITNRPTRLNSPYSALGEQLKAKGVNPTTIVAGSRLVGGNLRFSFRQSIFLAPEFHAFDRSSSGDWLVVWDATKSPDLPETLKVLVSELCGVSVSQKQAEFVEAPLKYTSKKQMKLGYVVLSQNNL